MKNRKETKDFKMLKEAFLNAGFIESDEETKVNSGNIVGEFTLPTNDRSVLVWKYDPLSQKQIDEVVRKMNEAMCYKEPIHVGMDTGYVDKKNEPIVTGNLVFIRETYKYYLVVHAPEIMDKSFDRSCFVLKSEDGIDVIELQQASARMCRVEKGYQKPKGLPNIKVKLIEE